MLLQRLIFIFFFLIANASFAITKISITKGSSEPIPVFIYDISQRQYELGTIPEKMKKVITNDLLSSGLFAFPKVLDINNKNIEFSDTPDFSMWRFNKITAVVTAQVQPLTARTFKINFRVWDVLTRSMIRQNEFEANTDNWRYLAHKTADDIHYALTGDLGFFNSKILYISETGPMNKRMKRIAIMDQDGANHQFLSQGRNLVLTPRFSPSMQKIIYLSYARQIPRLYIRDLRSGRENLVGEFPGMSFAPCFSPDGKNMLMSIARNGNTDIYRMDFASGDMTRITDSNAIETSPSYSPDGKRIAFVSDISGKPQIYVMNSMGGDAKRISYDRGSYTTPTWSPRGDLIAFTKQMNGSFYIGVMRTDGSGERLLTSGYLVEGPTWSPNGRRIIFTREYPSDRYGKVRSRIYSIDLTGNHETELKTPFDASDPNWSPLMR